MHSIHIVYCGNVVMVMAAVRVVVIIISEQMFNSVLKYLLKIESLCKRSDQLRASAASAWVADKQQLHGLVPGGLGTVVCALCVEMPWTVSCISKLAN